MPPIAEALAPRAMKIAEKPRTKKRAFVIILLRDFKFDGEVVICSMERPAM